MTTPPPSQPGSEIQPVPLNLTTKLSYGVGELTSEITSSILVFFILFYLTNVAGLNPALAGSAILISKVWDAINDPMVGWLSDRTRSPLGRRYPWMLIGAVPMGITFFLIWVIPNIDSQIGLLWYYSAIALLFYTAYTAVVLPYSTLVAELTQRYDERTKLVSYKAAFSIGGSIVGLMLAQLIFALVEHERHQYLILGGICSILAILAAYVCVVGTYRRFQWMQTQRNVDRQIEHFSLWQQIQIAFNTRPFLYVVGLYLCSWLGVQVTAAILPYFVVDWMGLADTHFTQMAIAVQGTALLMMAFWSWAGQRLGKQTIYCLGIPLTLIAQAGLFLLQPGQIGWMYALAVMAGAGLATAYIVPWSMLPDVVDLDELNTGYRREGIFYGFAVQVQKIAVAIALFMVGKILDWSGFITKVADQPPPVQPDSALQAIRWLIGPLPSMVLIGGLILAFSYPITRQVHDEIVLKLYKQKM
ncbi:MAG: MFS transporter [Cyanothece sp. SIO1E1]|nr:MFS transporter [Cyanothece sp. SIO1E1]